MRQPSGTDALLYPRNASSDLPSNNVRHCDAGCAVGSAANTTTAPTTSAVRMLMTGDYATFGRSNLPSPAAAGQPKSPEHAGRAGHEDHPRMTRITQIEHAR